MRDSRLFHTFILVTCLVLVTIPSYAQAQTGPFAAVEDVSGLPRVLLIGDSISIGYTIPVQEKLEGRFNVHRIPENGGNTQRGLDKIDAWLGKEPWDVIHFNWGLHDIRRVNAEGKMDASKPKTISLSEYRSNLTELVERLKKTNAKLIWASTTPVPVGAAGRRGGDEAAYNAVALDIMREHGVRINDLYNHIYPELSETQKDANVHFVDGGSAQLGKRVSEFVATSHHEQSHAGDFMTGFPPTDDGQVNRTNWYLGPQNRWGLQHVQELMPTQRVSRQGAEVLPLESAPLPVLGLRVSNMDGADVTVADWLRDSYTDGFLVLYKGEVVAETYLNDMEPDTLHNLFSMSKSYLGTIAGMLIDRGILNPDAPVIDYVPEMKGSAYGDALVRHVLDMNLGIRYVEDYADPESDVFRYSRAMTSVDNSDGLGLYDVLPTFSKEGEHGEQFHYVTANTDALGWIVQRASGRSLVELLSTEIWSKIGAEHDAVIISDINRTPFIGGGFNTTLRDSARFGLMMANGGKVGDRQIVPPGFIRDVQTFAIETGYPGTRYRSQWWVSPDMDAYRASGVAGQSIIIIPKLELVVVKFSSWPTLGGYADEGRAYDQRALEAITHYFDGKIDDD
ncbi:MAG: serine hydrolase [Candidatus Hydrogenedentota bacterium]